MKRIFFQSLMIVLISGLVGCLMNAFSSDPLPFIRPPDEREGKWPTVSSDELMQHLQDGTAILIDARDSKYFKEGHIPSAVNLPASRFGDVFAETGEMLPRDFPLIVYCQGSPCDESHDVLDRLEILEFQQLFLYEGGWMEWEKEKRPVETSEE